MDVRRKELRVRLDFDLVGRGMGDRQCDARVEPRKL